MAGSTSIPAPAGANVLPHRGEQPLAAVQRYFEVSLFLMIATSVATLVLTGKLDPISSIVPPAALVYKAVRYWRGAPPELSHRTATWLTVAYFAFFPFDLFFFSRGLAEGAPNALLYSALLAAIHLMLYAMMVRLYSASTTRDYLFLAMVAFATVLAAAILTVDTTFLILFLVFLVLAVSTFVGLEMRRSAEGAVAPPLAAGTPSARRLQRALSITSTSVAFSALALGTIIFLILPRFTAGYLSALNLQPTLISGFSDNVELGQIGVIKKNTSVVMRVRVQGGPAAMRGVRWRGIGLTTFDGKRWFSEKQDSEVVSPDLGTGWYPVGRLSAALRRNSRRVDYSVLLEPLATDTLFVAAEAVQVRGRFAHSFDRGGRPPRRSYLLLDRTNSLVNPYHNYARLFYEVSSAVPAVPAAELRAAGETYPEELLGPYLQLPPLDERIGELARRVTARAATAYDKAAAIEQHLRTQLGYTLDLSGTPPADPLAYFLFEKKAGHCEYFAAAMTVMLRTLGIPARYVNGFLPGEFNDVGEDFIVRASDAHSWVEVYFPEYGWMTFDPTPPADERARSWLGRLEFYWDWFELMWSEWVVNYDLSRQVTLAQNLQRASRDWSERTRKYLAQKRRATLEWLKLWQGRLADSPYTVPAGIALVLALAAVVRGRALRELLTAQWGLRFGSRAELTPRLATLHYLQMLRLLERRGLRKSAAQTPLEFAASISAAGLADPVGRLTTLYQAARFGAQHPDATGMSELLDSLKALLRSKPQTGPV